MFAVQVTVSFVFKILYFLKTLILNTYVIIIHNQLQKIKNDKAIIEFNKTYDKSIVGIKILLQTNANV